MPTREVEVHYRDAETKAFEHVATVEVDVEMSTNASLELAYIYTQNVHGSWSQGHHFEDGAFNPDHHPSVTRHVPLHEHEGKTYGLRSSMVGDKFVIGDETYFVGSLGFVQNEG